MRKPTIWFRVFLILFILALGVGIKKGLEALKKPPQTRPREEAVLHAPAMQVRFESVRTRLIGFGTVRAARRAPIGVEVAGRIVSVNPTLQTGLTVARDEELFLIDPRAYQASLDQAEADVAALQSERARLKQQEKNDERHLEVVRRIFELAKRDYERFRKLVEEEKVEARSRFEAVEQLYRQREEQLVVLEDVLALYPIQIRQTDSRLVAARARAEQARLNLEKTRVTAPFAGRIDMENVELGQMVAPGAPLLTLVDDASLEIAVPIEGDEMARWLDLAPSAENPHWFDRLSSATAGLLTLRWTEDSDATIWNGRLDRVERFDPQTRTVTLVATDFTPASSNANGDQTRSIPLVEGMFCRVEIPGRMALNVARIPRSAVSQDETVYLVNTERLKSQPVEVVRYEGETALVSGGLKEGDVVLKTRPGNALDGVRVSITNELKEK